ncbi:MAG: hypothetical protein GXX10_09320 [Clostridiaceae bacterium]|nr:hypothetical protein [Clostridiaceae bacterium]
MGNRPGNQNGQMPQRPGRDGDMPQMPGGFNGELPQIPEVQGGMIPQRPGNNWGAPQIPDIPDGWNFQGQGSQNGEFPQIPGSQGEFPQIPGNQGEFPGFPENPDAMTGPSPNFSQNTEDSDTKEGSEGNNTQNRQNNGRLPGNNGAWNIGRGMGPGMGGMGSNDVRLIYTDDNHSSYSNIFDNAVFDVSNSDKDRLIASLKQLNEQSNIEEVVDVDKVISYFAAHNFVLNGDSYTGSIVHNYYLREYNGKLSMIPWDYNLAFGGMIGGASDATSLVNYPIDSPASGDMNNLPMLSWIFSSSEYTQKYHETFDKFISSYYESGYFEEMIDKTIEMIKPYVEKDPTAFCTYEEFLEASEQLKKFCLLRAESVRKQLDGVIPSTREGQAKDSSNFVDASSVNVSSMGSNRFGMGRKRMTNLTQNQN